MTAFDILSINISTNWKLKKYMESKIIWTDINII